MDKADKIFGCILGGAVGDCLGGPYEGRAAPVLIDYQREWRTSDDTQMTLATCEAISAHRKVDPEQIAGTFARWHRARRFTGIGASTYKALTELARGGHWALVGNKGERAAGNGAAMRIAPLAFCLDPKTSRDRATIRDVCRITHHNEEAYAGALAVALAVRLAWDGSWSGDDLMRRVIDHLPDTSVRDRLIEISRIDQNVSLLEIANKHGSSGYVIESVPLALCGAERVRRLGFQSMLEKLIAAGGDTDTNASIAGQIADALIGREKIPQELISRLPDLSDITSIVEKFIDSVD
ncbi:MAG: ADP-ribosylglycohydrolase family protein [Acidobacteriota bacterium]